MPSAKKPVVAEKSTAPKKKSNATKQTKSKAATPVTEPVAALPDAKATEVVAPDAETSVVLGLQTDFTAFLTKLQQATTLLSEMKQQFRVLEKKTTRELKAAEKANAKRKRKAGNRSPSGFVKPTLISNELASFLGKDQGTEMARTEVTREINAYIRKQGLQDKDNGRKINADRKLQTLLKLKPNEELTYFNLQRYMSPHFAKANKAVVEKSE